MYKIGIIGSGPEYMSEPEKIKRAIGRTIDLLGFEYGKENVLFCVEAHIGTGLWAANECINKDYKYHLFLPYALDITCEHWYEEQKNMLKYQYNNVYSLTIYNQENAYKPLIDSSNLIVSFWAGNNGRTSSAIKYALQNNKIVLDGLQKMQLITNNDIRKTKKHN